MRTLFKGFRVDSELWIWTSTRSDEARVAECLAGIAPEPPEAGWLRFSSGGTILAEFYLMQGSDGMYWYPLLIDGPLHVDQPKGWRVTVWQDDIPLPTT